MKKTELTIAQECEKHSFVVVEFRNGHLHTLKAFGHFNVWIGSSQAGCLNQLEYLSHVAENESTDIYDVRASNSMAEAVELEIIDGEGGFF